MPPKGYRTVTVREDVKGRLDELMRRYGFESLNDLLLHMSVVFEEWVNYLSRMYTLTVAIADRLGVLEGTTEKRK